MSRIDLFIFGYLWYRRRRERTIKKKNISKKRLWVRPIFVQSTRDSQGAGQNLIKEMQLNDHLKYENFFRMGPDGFEELLRLVGPIISKSDLGRQPIAPQIRLGLTIRFLASGDSMASISYLFRIGLSTVSQIIAEVTEVLWTVLQNIFVSAPSQAKWKNDALLFDKLWNFPNCVGAIDGKHVNIVAPPHSGSDFFNYKGTHSIVLLALVGPQYTFSIVDIGAQGRQSDGGIFRNSTLGHLMVNGDLNLPEPSMISEGGPEMPYVVVGDAAFPLQKNLMKLYSLRDLDVEKTIYNYRLSRARRIVENAFGILAARWRIYGNNMMGKLDNIVKIIQATICLHNFIIKKFNNPTYLTPGLLDSENTEGSWRQFNTILESNGRIGANVYSQDASDIRNEFCRYFNEEGAVSSQWNKL